MKSRGKIIFEGLCYTVMLGGPPWIDLYTRHFDTMPTQNEFLAAGIISAVAIATGLKAFASSTGADEKLEMKAEVKAAVKEEKTASEEKVSEKV